MIMKTGVLHVRKNNGTWNNLNEQVKSANDMPESALDSVLNGPHT